MMRLARLIVVSIGFALCTSLAYGASNTQYKEIGRLDLHDGGTIDIHPLSGETWGLANCTGATHARIAHNATHREDFLAIALAAKHTGNRVMIRAECGAIAAVIDVEVIYSE